MAAVGGKNQNDVSEVVSKVNDLEIAVNALDDDILELEKGTAKVGDIKALWGIIADEGWIEAIGNNICKIDAGGDYGDEVKALYLHLWALLAAVGTADDWFYIEGLTKGASALADWDAEVKININCVDFLRYANESAPGKKYIDTMQGHKHPAHDGEPYPIYGYGGTTPVLAAAGEGVTALQNIKTNTPVSDGTNGTPRTGSETVPKHARVKAQIKL